MVEIKEKGLLDEIYLQQQLKNSLHQWEWNLIG